MNAPRLQPEPAPDQMPPRLTLTHQAVACSVPGSPPRPHDPYDKGWPLEIIATRPGTCLVSPRRLPACAFHRLKPPVRMQVRWLPTLYDRKQDAIDAAAVYATDLKAMFYNPQAQGWVLEWHLAWINNNEIDGLPSE